jgi:hypothetical protein
MLESLKSRAKLEIHSLLLKEKCKVREVIRMIVLSLVQKEFSVKEITQLIKSLSKSINSQIKNK